VKANYKYTSTLHTLSHTLSLPLPALSMKGDDKRAIDERMRTICEGQQITTPTTRVHDDQPNNNNLNNVD